MNKMAQDTDPRSTTAECNLLYRLSFVRAADVAIAPALLGPASHSVYPSCVARALGFSGTGLSGPATRSQTRTTSEPFAKEMKGIGWM